MTQKLLFLKQLHTHKNVLNSPKDAQLGTLVLGDFHVTLNKDLALGVHTHGVTGL